MGHLFSAIWRPFVTVLVTSTQYVDKANMIRQSGLGAVEFPLGTNDYKLR